MLSPDPGSGRGRPLDPGVGPSEFSCAARHNHHTETVTLDGGDGYRMRHIHGAPHSQKSRGRPMTTPIDLEVQLVHRRRSIAILSDGQELPVTKWANADGECDPDEATACVCGPCAAAKWYNVDLRGFEGVISQ